MVYPNEHKLLTASGTLFTGTLERWSFGLRFYDQPTFHPPTQAMVDACKPAFATWFDSAVTIGGTHSLDTLKLATIDVNGRYPAGHSPSIATFVPPEFPAVAAVGLPGQISMVVSLRTVKPRGIAHAGRIYLPPSSLQVGSDGRWSTAQALGAANATRTLLNALNLVTDLGDLAVFSDVGAGDFEYVTGVRVGRVPDTVRRRRRQLVEDYQAVAL